MFDTLCYLLTCIPFAGLAFALSSILFDALYWLLGTIIGGTLSVTMVSYRAASAAARLARHWLNQRTLS